MLQVFVTKTALLQQAAVNAKTYNDAMSICKNCMGISLPNAVTISTLCLKYGFDSINSVASSMLSTYQSSAGRMPVPDTSEHRSLCHGVVFYLAAKKNNVKSQQNTQLFINYYM